MLHSNRIGSAASSGARRPIDIASIGIASNTLLRWMKAPELVAEKWRDRTSARACWEAGQNLSIEPVAGNFVCLLEASAATIQSSSNCFGCRGDSRGRKASPSPRTEQGTGSKRVLTTPGTHFREILKSSSCH